MDLRQLRYLRAVVRLGSVTNAAATEHVAQPAISKQLASLERELGVPLFHRVGRRVVPTDAALQLADCADRVVDDLAATVAAISGARPPRNGSPSRRRRPWSTTCSPRRCRRCSPATRG